MEEYGYRTRICPLCHVRVFVQSFEFHMTQCQQRRNQAHSKKPSKKSKAQQEKNKHEQKEPSEHEEKFPCHLCGYPQTLLQLDQHHKRCPNREVNCPDCGQIFPYNIMDEHRYYCRRREEVYRNRVAPDLSNSVQRNSQNAERGPVPARQDNPVLERVQNEESSRISSSSSSLLSQMNSSNQRVESSIISQPSRTSHSNNTEVRPRQSLFNSIRQPRQPVQPQQRRNPFINPAHEANRPQQRSNPFINLEYEANRSGPHVQRRLPPQYINSVINRNFRQWLERDDPFAELDERQQDSEEQQHIHFRRVDQGREFVGILRRHLVDREVDFRIIEASRAIRQIAVSSQINVNDGGLTKIQIKKIPNKSYVKEKKQGQENENCAICFIQLEDGQEVKDLICKHVYHANCIEQWMKINSFCPLCKGNLKESIKQTKSQKLKKSKQPKVKSNRSQLELPPSRSQSQTQPPPE